MTLKSQLLDARNGPLTITNDNDLCELVNVSVRAALTADVPSDSFCEKLGEGTGQLRELSPAKNMDFSDGFFQGISRELGGL